MIITLMIFSQKFVMKETDDTFVLKPRKWWKIVWIILSLLFLILIIYLLGKYGIKTIFNQERKIIFAGRGYKSLNTLKENGIFPFYYHAGFISKIWFLDLLASFFRIIEVVVINKKSKILYHMGVKKRVYQLTDPAIILLLKKNRKGYSSLYLYYRKSRERNGRYSDNLKTRKARYNSSELCRMRKSAEFDKLLEYFEEIGVYTTEE